MAEDPTRPVIAAAFAHLREQVVLATSEFDEDATLTMIALRSLDALQARILHDPAWVEELEDAIKRPTADFLYGSRSRPVTPKRAPITRVLVCSARFSKASIRSD
jgi:hypothetical protein